MKIYEILKAISFFFAGIIFFVVAALNKDLILIAIGICFVIFGLTYLMPSREKESGVETTGNVPVSKK